MKSLQLRVYEILEGSEKKKDKNVYRRFFEIFIVAVILINILVIILNSIDSLNEDYGDIFMFINLVCVAIFTVEYVFRIWACTAGPKKHQHPVFGRLAYAVMPFPLIDLLSIVPFYITLTGLFSINLSFLRILRLLRILRIAKIGRYSDSMKIMGNVIREKKEQLVAVVFLLILFVIVAAAIMYEVEGGDEGFESIPECMWWSIVTLTTVGYGDVVPTTGLGRFVGGVIAVSGIVFYALPTAIVGAGFVQEYQKRKERKERKDREDFTCPHCGEMIIR